MQQLKGARQGREDTKNFSSCPRDNWMLQKAWFEGHIEKFLSQGQERTQGRQTTFRTQGEVGSL